VARYDIATVRVKMVQGTFARTVIRQKHTFPDKLSSIGKQTTFVQYILSKTRKSIHLGGVLGLFLGTSCIGIISYVFNSVEYVKNKLKDLCK